jgi:hypothetical protein
MKHLDEGMLTWEAYTRARGTGHPEEMVEIVEIAGEKGRSK